MNLTVKRKGNISMNNDEPTQEALSLAEHTLFGTVINNNSEKEIPLEIKENITFNNIISFTKWRDNLEPVQSIIKKMVNAHKVGGNTTAEYHMKRLLDRGLTEHSITTLAKAMKRKGDI